jgi:hypothetical protein
MAIIALELVQVSIQLPATPSKSTRSQKALQETSRDLHATALIFAAELAQKPD